MNENEQKQTEKKEKELKTCPRCKKTNRHYS